MLRRLLLTMVVPLLLAALGCGEKTDQGKTSGTHPKVPGVKVEEAQRKTAPPQ